MRREAVLRGGRAIGRAAVVGAALLALHLSLTFVNVWPTLRVRASGELTVELALAVMVLAVVVWRGGLSTRWVRGLAIIWVLLVIGHYVDVTTRSLYGRDVNLYWDLRHVPKVGAMFATVASAWQVAAVIGAALLLPCLIYLAARWCFGQLIRAMSHPPLRWGFGVAGAVVCLLFAWERLGAAPADEATRFAEPVSVAYLRELYEFAYELSGVGVAALADPPALASDLSRVAGADVFVIFIESYGAVSWEHPPFVDELAEPRAQFDRAIRDTGRAVVSGFVESTTFGGESWLAHISFLSGTAVRDDYTNTRLMAQERDTLVKVFNRGGYRTVAVMPGHLVAWPEGAFYGFDDVYDHARLDYRGPPFGWWSITDQYALARVDAAEIAPADGPRFVFVTTLSTHAPFVPAPPYQPDWSRMLTPRPYDAAALDRAWSDWADWMNLGPSYVKALRYAYRTIGGYLRLRADRDLVMILVGDHQPPSMVSGEGASWNVPVHVVASRPAIVERLRADGFGDGLTPRGPPLASLDTLLPIMLRAFGEPD